MRLISYGLFKLRRFYDRIKKHGDSTSASQTRGVESAPMRILIISNAVIPTVQLCLLKPLGEMIAQGTCSVDFLTEQQLKEKFGKGLRSAESWAWVEERWAKIRPTFVVFCRYSGPHAMNLLSYCKANSAPSMYCIDDDILNVPIELGQQKFDYHNHPLRLQAVRHLLDNVDLVYCSNSRLKSRLSELGVSGNLQAGDIFCAGEPILMAELRTVKTIGYMGFDHAHDFEVALPGLINVLRKYPALRFELFGKIPKPEALDEFGDRVMVLPVVPDYDEFLTALAGRRWDIGICPLAHTEFNKVKNVNKWIEYSAVGAAVIATEGMIYDDCCAEDCGVLTNETGWEQALTLLIENPCKRFELACSAQNSLSKNYSLRRLREQVMDMFSQTIDCSQHRV